MISGVPSIVEFAEDVLHEAPLLVEDQIEGIGRWQVLTAKRMAVHHNWPPEVAEHIVTVVEDGELALTVEGTREIVEAAERLEFGRADARSPDPALRTTISHSWNYLSPSFARAIGEAWAR